MRTGIISKLSLIIAAVFVLSACSTIKTASIEKRRYQKGYHINIAQHAAKQADLNRELKAIEKESETADHSSHTPEQSKVVKNKTKRIKAALKELKKKKNLREFVAALDDIPNKPIINTKRNLASSPKPSQGIFGGSETNPPDTRTSLIILLIILLVIFLLLIEPIVAILMAVLLALLIIWVLRELRVIDK